MREMWVQPLGGEATLEDSMVTHPSILAWRILMDRGAWQATSPRGRKESDRHGSPHFCSPFRLVLKGPESQHWRLPGAQGKLCYKALGRQRQPQMPTERAGMAGFQQNWEFHSIFMCHGI